MTIEEDILHEVQQSFGRCAIHGGFFDRFRTHYKASAPLPPGLGRQPGLLKEDLVQLLCSAEDPHRIPRSGAMACRIPPQLSRFWIDALMMTVREYDEKFSPELERKWRAVLQKSLAASGSFKLPA
jgi:hypothetical protein